MNSAIKGVGVCEIRSKSKRRAKSLGMKPGPSKGGGVLRNSYGDVLLIFSNNVSVCDSNEMEAEVLVILGALRLFSRSFGW